MRHSLFLVAAALVFAASAALAAQIKVDICHVPPGNPSAAHLITVGKPAVPAHLAHGDIDLAELDDEVPSCACPCLVEYRDCLSECDCDCAAVCAGPTPSAECLQCRERCTACQTRCAVAYGTCLAAECGG